MFTGIVEGTGKSSVQTDQGITVLSVAIDNVSSWDLNVGQSICVNGACLTVIDSANNGDNLVMKFSVMPETLSRTNLDQESKVNIERSVKVSDRFEGHVVQGHVDTTAMVIDISANADSLGVMFEVGGQNIKYLIPKGSVAINGVSLTVVDPVVIADDRARFSVWLIPHTRSVTNLGDLQVGDTVNIEFDIMGKYMVNYLEHVRS